MTSHSGESVISRVARILAAFDRETRSMPLTVLADRTGLPLPTTYRLVSELVRYGLLERDADKQIRVGLRLWELSTRGNETLSLRDTALPYMEDLFESLGCLTTLSVLDGGTLLYVERMTPTGFSLDRALVAQRHPIHAASSGLVLLAFAPADVQDEFLTKPLRKYTENTITDERTLRRLLAEIRKQRFCSAPGIGTPGWTGMAVPIFGAARQVVAALSVVYESGTERPREAVPALHSASFGISMALGVKPPRRS
ncbi:IclR family transcriptional regulator [Gordonia humi]|uniref:DNA-binding IclR family transcriptional regulator n=1 Tax=Gordonia humi TaxID=686429 RepID=A0A840ET48_9ACTN|nr:IclR family transcriptional regulator [Gordonia humi]MBB4133534.1 DNA-binding IclR family transcriptional regulator [Gordonia humi]